MGTFQLQPYLMQLKMPHSKINLLLLLWGEFFIRLRNVFSDLIEVMQ